MARSHLLGTLEGRCSVARQLAQALQTSLSRAEAHLAAARSGPYAARELADAQAQLRAAPVLDAVQLSQQELRPREKQLLARATTRANANWKAVQAALVQQQARGSQSGSQAPARGVPATSAPAAAPTARTNHAALVQPYQHAQHLQGATQPAAEHMKLPPVPMSQVDFVQGTQFVIEEEDTDTLKTVLEQQTWSTDALWNLLWFAAEGAYPASLGVILEFFDPPGWWQCWGHIMADSDKPLALHIIHAASHRGWSAVTSTLDLVVERDPSFLNVRLDGLRPDELALELCHSATQFEAQANLFQVHKYLEHLRTSFKLHANGPPLPSRQHSAALPREASVPGDVPQLPPVPVSALGEAKRAKALQAVREQDITILKLLAEEGKLGDDSLDDLLWAACSEALPASAQLLMEELIRSASTRGWQPVAETLSLVAEGEPRLLDERYIEGQRPEELALTLYQTAAEPQAQANYFQVYKHLEHLRSSRRLHAAAPAPPPPPQPAGGLLPSTTPGLVHFYSPEQLMQEALECVEDDDADRLSVVAGLEVLDEEDQLKLIYEAATQVLPSVLQVLLGALSREVVQGWSGIATETEDGQDQFMIQEVLQAGRRVGWGPVQQVVKLMLQDDQDLLLRRVNAAGELPVDIALLWGAPLDVIKLLAPEAGKYAGVYQPRPPTRDYFLDEYVLKQLQQQITDQCYSRLPEYGHSASGRRILEYLAATRAKLLGKKPSEKALAKARAETAPAAPPAPPPQQQQQAAVQAPQPQRAEQGFAETMSGKLDQQQPQRPAQQPQTAPPAAATPAAAGQGFAEMLRGKLDPAQDRNQDFRDLTAAARGGSVATLRAALKRQKWSSKELATVLWYTMVQARSWPATQEVLQGQDQAALLSSMVFRVPEKNGSEHIIFKLISLSAELYERATSNDLATIIRHVVTVDPGILHKRDAHGYNNPARAAIEAGAPLEVLRALTPCTERSTWQAATGPPNNTCSLLQAASQLVRSHQHGQWAEYYRGVVAHLRGLEDQYEQELRQQREAALEQLKAQATKLLAGVEAGDLNTVRDLLPVVTSSDHKALRPKAFPAGGLKGYLDSCILKAPSVDVMEAFIQAAGECGNTIASLAKLCRSQMPLLPTALQARKHDLALQLVERYPDCVRSPSVYRPPLLVAIAAGAPLPLVVALIEASRRHRKDMGGIDEADESRGSLTALAVAIQTERGDVLEKLLEHSRCWQMLVDDRQWWTPLCYAISQGRSTMALRLLQHAREHLPAGPAKAGKYTLPFYLNITCDGAPALLRAVDSMADTGLPGLLLESGADPSVFGRTRDDRKTTALHLAIKKG
ncbi:hypothetical protein N2152v2_006032 [Parachlorella kessleri]